MSVIVISVIVLLGLSILTLLIAAGVNYYTSTETSDTTERTIKAIAIMQLIGIVLLIVGSLAAVYAIWSPITKQVTKYVDSPSGASNIAGGIAKYQKEGAAGLAKQILLPEE